MSAVVHSIARADGGKSRLQISA